MKHATAKSDHGHHAEAGHLKLDKLTVLWDHNSISIDGSTELATSEDQLKRFAAAGWATKSVDGHDFAAVAAALSASLRSKKPTFIACRTIIGLGAPTKAGTAGVHGSPLGAAEAAGAKSAMGWNYAPFEVPEGLKSAAFPSMMLQTLVENAIKHGLEPAAAGGRLEIRAEIVDGQLAVHVIDTGKGFAPDAGSGVGLANIRERLKAMYDGRAELVISVPAGGGTCATIKVPYAVAATPQPE